MRFSTAPLAGTGVSAPDSANDEVFLCVDAQLLAHFLADTLQRVATVISLALLIAELMLDNDPIEVLRQVCAGELFFGYEPAPVCLASAHHRCPYQPSRQFHPRIVARPH